jgi:hypothetical protein
VGIEAGALELHANANAAHPMQSASQGDDTGALNRLFKGKARETTLGN